MTADDEAVKERIDRFLEEVAARLPDRTPAERAEVLRNLELHIREALESRGDAPTASDVEAVLAEMDPPASYGPRSSAPRHLPPARPDARVCLWPVAGWAIVLCAAAGIAGLIHLQQREQAALAKTAQIQAIQGYVESLKHDRASLMEELPKADAAEKERIERRIREIEEEIRRREAELQRIREVHGIK